MRLRILSNHSNRKFKKVSKIEFLKISFLEVPILEHEKIDRLTDAVPMNNVKIDNRIWRQQMIHNHFQNFQRQVYVNPTIFQLLAGKIFPSAVLTVRDRKIISFFDYENAYVSKNDFLIN